MKRRLVGSPGKAFVVVRGEFPNGASWSGLVPSRTAQAVIRDGLRPTP
jgi:hypothetical protein